MLNAVINRCIHSTCIQLFTVHLYQNQEQFQLISLNCVILGNIFLMSMVQLICRCNRNVFYNEMLLDMSFYKQYLFIHSEYIGNTICYQDIFIIYLIFFLLLKAEKGVIGLSV